MKQFLLLVLVFVGSMSLSAQNATVATLDSEDGSKSFYGSRAFIDAVAEAKEGDRITLSGGTFESTTVDKCLKIQGAGFVEDVKNGVYKTVLTGDLNINLEKSSSGLLLEGFYTVNSIKISANKEVVLDNAVIKKCRVNAISLSIMNKNMRIEHCRLSDGVICPYSDKLATNLLVVNSVLARAVDTNVSSLNFLNCVIGSVSFAVARFENCILKCAHYDDNNPINSKNTIINCVALSDKMFNDIVAWNGSSYSTPEKVFKEVVDNNYSDDATYELTDDAKKLYTDNNGSEIGIYGGINPYTATPSNPQVISKKIDSRSSNGKLNVEIKLKAQNY